MKKAICFVLCLLLSASLYACAPAPTSQEEATIAPAESPSATDAPSPEPLATPALTVTPAVTVTPAPSPTPTGPKMYSSFADLVSFDPSTNVAQFDYFDILRGDEAVEYLVEHDGYTEAEAQALVDDYADSEFIKKNSSSALRAIDLDDVSLSLMYQPSGEIVEDEVTPVPSTASDFRKIYAQDSSLLLDSFFFYINVESDGHVSLVEQVYWA